MTYNHLKILRALSINDGTIIAKMTFSSRSNLYKPLRELTVLGFVSRHLILNPKTGRGCRRYILAYRLTKKGKKHIEQEIRK